MANAGPDTNGSQFFLVYANSALRPNYTIFGEVDAAGLATLDRIAAGEWRPPPRTRAGRRRARPAGHHPQGRPLAPPPLTVRRGG
ncbi:peptidylprolyl isomerase [Micromonospora sp. M12]